MRPGWQVDRCSIGVQAASSKMGRSKLGKMGEEQAAIQTGDASSKMGEAWQARQDKEQAASKMGET